MADTMLALVYRPPGGLGQIKVEQFPKPTALGDGEMLIKVRAAAVMYQEPVWPIYQAKDGSYPPHIPCHDFSGTIVAVGPGVHENSDIRVGSEVYAFTSTPVEPGSYTKKYQGGAAEFAVADVHTAVTIPKGLDLLEAASVPLAALTAWQALHDHAFLKAGQKILITGSAGATGLWAVQMAYLIGAEVIGTASSNSSIEILKSIGVKEIINYKTHRVEDSVKDVDVVLDCVGDTVGGDFLQQCGKAVKPGGKIVSIVDYMASQQVPEGVSGEFFIVAMNREQLVQIGQLIEAGKLRTFVDSTFSLERAVEAFEKGAEGHARGRILIDVEKREPSSL